MQIAGVYNDDILMKEAFLKLKINKMYNWMTILYIVV